MMRTPLLLQLLATGLATSASAPASYDPLRDDPDSMSVGCLDHSDCTVLGYRWGYLHTTHYLHTICTLSKHYLPRLIPSSPLSWLDLVLVSTLVATLLLSSLASALQSLAPA